MKHRQRCCALSYLTHLSDVSPGGPKLRINMLQRRSSILRVRIGTHLYNVTGEDESVSVQSQADMP